MYRLVRSKRDEIQLGLSQSRWYVSQSSLQCCSDSSFGWVICCSIVKMHFETFLLPINWRFLTWHEWLFTRSLPLVKMVVIGHIFPMPGDALNRLTGDRYPTKYLGLRALETGRSTFLSYIKFLGCQFLKLSRIVKCSVSKGSIILLSWGRRWKPMSKVEETKNLEFSYF